MTFSTDQFLSEVSSHQLFVLNDEGPYRHLQFKPPHTGLRAFDIVTWPRHLVYTGYLGSYTFAGAPDMFEVFRSSSNQELCVYPEQWVEHVKAMARTDTLRRFNSALFEQAVLSAFRHWLRLHRGDTSPADRRALWSAIQERVLRITDGPSGWQRQKAASDFCFWVNDEVGEFEFPPFGEHQVHSFSTRFLWCCYAIAWGIVQYDQCSLKGPHLLAA